MPLNQQHCRIDGVDNMNDFIRPCAIELHPVNLKDYILPTPPLDALLGLAARCIRIGKPGIVVYAHPRFGKTYAIRYVTTLLRESYPRLVILSVDAPVIRGTSREEYYVTFLDAVGHAAPETGTYARKKRRLVQTMVQRVEDARGNMIVLFVDEAQKWGISDYEELRDVHDALEKRHIRMVTFLVGQPSLIAQKAVLRETQNTQITARFMVGEHEFRGIRSAEDVATCLQGYDTARFPEESAWTYTKFFFPQAWASGLRLVGEASRVHTAFKDAFQDAGMNGPVEIPMQYLVFAVQILLDTFSERDEPEFRPSAANWRAAVDESGFVDGEREMRFGETFRGGR